MNKIALVVFLVLQGILAIYLGDAFWNPSKYVYTFGGDGAFIYYNMIFHTFFGDGLVLESMNYPKFESLLMTDAQAGLSLIFSNLHDLFPNAITPERIVGWSHRFHYIMIGLTGVYFLKILDLFSINKGIAAGAAIILTLLSPMMIRLAAGHFGLAYPFVFAFTFYYISKLFLDKKTTPFNFALFCFVILFFGLNNFYIGMINLTFAMLFAMYMIAFKSSRIIGTKLLSQVAVLVLILYAMIHFTDPGMDRVEIQWGYFSNRVSFSSFLYPPTGLLHSLLSMIADIKTFAIESWINLGFVSISITISGIILLSIKRIKFSTTAHRQLFLGLSIVCFVMLLYASAIFYRIPFLKEHFFHKIGLLTMFKASARFAWPLFIATGVFAAYSLQEIVKLLPPHVRKITLIVLLIVSTYEVHLYLGRDVFTQMYGNPYSQETKDRFLQIIEDDSIDLADYQALYSVPVMEGWNDKFQIVPHFQSEYNSILFSMSTGLPMINGMLSRIGVTDASKSIQLSGHPLIKKEKLLELDANKDLILVYGKGAKHLTIGERYLLDHSEILSDQKEFQLRSLKLEVLKSDQMREDYQSYFDTTSVDSKHVHVGFDEIPTKVVLAGEGSKTISSDTILFENSLNFVSDSVECSIYVKLDNQMYGNPQFFVDLIQKDGTILNTINFNSYQSRDIQLGWIRASSRFEINDEIHQLRISAKEINQTFLIDELCIRPIDIKSKTVKETGDLLYDNYLIDK